MIDSHVHVFPDFIENLSTKGLPSEAVEKIEQVRKKLRLKSNPIADSLHRALMYSRHLPKLVRDGVDQFGIALPIVRLLMEATPEDLQENLQQNRVTKALVIAHPPFSSNEFVIETCRTRPNWFPVVSIPRGTDHPDQVLEQFVNQGAVALKIHTASDGEEPSASRYRLLLRKANELKIPVILHTGCFHTNLFFRRPDLGEVDTFKKWFEKYPDLQFVLAHMNYHDPEKAMEFCETYPNLFVDTSWQPSEVIGEAVRRIGAERVLFGSDWPLLGNNTRVSLSRIHDCVNTGVLNLDQADLILEKNAEKLFRIGDSPEVDRNAPSEKPVSSVESKESSSKKKKESKRSDSVRSQKVASSTKSPKRKRSSQPKKEGNASQSHRTEPGKD